MIKVNEIRCGNMFIGYDNEQFQFGLDNFVDVFNLVDLDEIIKNPIPITCDWLENNGFMRTDELSSCYKRYLNTETSDHCFIKLKQSSNLIWDAIFMNEGSINPHKIELKYVHQLQNLWFSTTNTEII